MAIRPIVKWTSVGTTERWFPTTLDKIGKYEEFLEDILATSPELLLLESRRTGVRGPFAVFRRISMQTPSGRGIFPDIVILAASGHVVVVEVKRYVNPELKDRAVIAQIIDYASSFAALTSEQCVGLFGPPEATAWTESVQKLFPEDPAPEELAEVLLGRMQRGELNLVIACDKIPPGLPDVVSGIATQSALGFELDLLEVVPYVREISESAEVLLVPSTRLATEIVSRTAVTVTYREGDAKPSTTVQATSLTEIEANLKSVNRVSQLDAKIWTLEDIEEECRTIAHPVALKLFDFAKQYSADGQVVAPGKKQNASFGFYVKTTRNGKTNRKMIFTCILNWSVVYMYLNFAESITSSQTVETLRQKLKTVLGSQVDVSQKELGIPFNIVDKNFDEFQSIMLWFKSEAENLSSL